MSQRAQARLHRRLSPSTSQFAAINPRDPGKPKLTAVMALQEPPSRTRRIDQIDNLKLIPRSAMKITQPAGAHLQITLADCGDQPRSTYVAIVERGLVDGHAMQRGDLVGVTLEARGFGDLAQGSW